MDKHIEQFLDCTNIGSFVFDANEDTIFRFLVLREIFTPYEIDKKFMDESIYEDSHYGFCRITNVIETAGDTLVELSIYNEDEDSDEEGNKTFSYSGRKEYYLLSKIRLSKFDIDNPYED